MRVGGFICDAHFVIVRSSSFFLLVTWEAVLGDCGKPLMSLIMQNFSKTKKTIKDTGQLLKKRTTVLPT